MNRIINKFFLFVNTIFSSPSNCGSVAVVVVLEMLVVLRNGGWVVDQVVMCCCCCGMGG